MVKGGTQMVEQALNLPAIDLKKSAELSFASASEMSEVSMVGKISEKLNVKVRFNRLKKRMRNRSTNIL